MPDYKEMYLKMFRTVESVIKMLIEAQRACEDIYIASSEIELQVSEVANENTADED